MLQLRRTQKTKDGQEVKHQDHICCTIMCGYCGKRRHYENECHIKHRESEKLKKVQEERRKNAGKGGKPEGGALTLEVLSVRVTLAEDKGPQPPPLLEEDHPTPHLRVSRRVKNGLPPPVAALDGADKSSENAKKSKLNWHSHCLQAAGVEVKFPDEG